jgi:hypothetical protein
VARSFPAPVARSRASSAAGGLVSSSQQARAALASPSELILDNGAVLSPTGRSSLSLAGRDDKPDLHGHFCAARARAIMSFSPRRRSAPAVTGLGVHDAETMRAVRHFGLAC